MAQLAATPTPVSSFRLTRNQIHFNTYWYLQVAKENSSVSFSDTFFLLANQSLDPNLQNIASDYIVHYDYDEVDSALLSSSLTS